MWQRLRKLVPPLAILLVMAYWLATGGISDIKWTAAGSLEREPASFALAEEAHLNLGLVFSPTNPQWAVAGGGEPAILVAFDQTAGLLRTFGRDGTLLASFGEKGMLEGQFLTPVGLAVDRDGRIAVADRELPVVKFFEPSGDPAGGTPPVQNVHGWGDTAFGPGGVLVASPDPVSGFHGAGVHLFSPAQGGGYQVNEIGNNCFGPVAVDGQGNIYVVNLREQLEGQSRQYLVSLSPEGEQRFRRRLDDASLKSDLTYWAAADRLIVVNSGGRRLEAISTDGRTISTILETDPEKAPPIAAVPFERSLYVVFVDGDVIVYGLTQ